MYRTVLAFALSALPSIGMIQAQAPIERQFPAPPSSGQLRSSQQWTRLERWSAHGYKSELRIHSINGIFRCTLDRISDQAVFCTEYRPTHSVRDFIYPRLRLDFPRSEIIDIRAGGRDLSTLVGVGVGAAIGGIEYAGRNDQIIGVPLLATIGGIFGHFIPSRGYVVYREP